MANTFTQINIHTVFTVFGKENLLLNHFRSDLFRYIAGTLNDLEQYSLAVNGFTDHVHAFFELKPTSCLSDIIKEVKAGSSKWINDNKFVKGRFSWQEGYGSFSYSRSQRDNVIKYIMNQEVHHQKKSFKEEYLNLLSKFEIEYDPKYLFEFIE